MLKNAIFDFDGTLFDSMFIWDRAGELYLESLGMQAPALLGEELRNLSLNQAARRLITLTGLSLGEEEVMEGINRTIEHFYLQEVLPKPGAKDFLRQLRERGVSLCIATASERYQIQAALSRCQMEGLVEEIFTCTQVGRGKDEPHIFRRALQELGGEKEETLVFEDALYAARTAKEDGFVVVGVRDQSEPCPKELRELVDFYLNDFLHTEDFWRWVWER